MIPLRLQYHNLQGDLALLPTITPGRAIPQNNDELKLLQIRTTSQIIPRRVNGTHKGGGVGCITRMKGVQEALKVSSQVDECSMLLLLCAALA